EKFIKLRTEAMRTLQEEAELDGIVRLVGVDALSMKERVTLETAKSIREDYLHQNAFHETDTYTSLEKQLLMLQNIMEFDRAAKEAVAAGVDVDDLFALDVCEKIGRMKYV